MFALVALIVALASDSSARVIPNDNRHTAGQLKNGVLAVQIDASTARWFPEGTDGPNVVIAAFGERGKKLQIPGPLIRVPVGTEVRVTLRNRLAQPMLVRGLYDRSANSDSIDIAPGAEREVRFRAMTPGTYFYWGRTAGDRIGFGPSGDSQLKGAIVVDPPGAPRDRLLVISGWTHPEDTALTVGERRELLAINGLSWPHTERFTFNVGDTVRWRVLNLSTRVHPMHLHGFYFTVDSRGTAARDTIYPLALQRRAVTEYMTRATTMTMTWVPTRPGNWLFHCHLIAHISPLVRKQMASTAARHDGSHAANHAFESMAGLVAGIEVKQRGPIIADDTIARRRLRLFVQKRPRYFGTGAGYGFIVQGDSAEPARDSIRIPGTPIVLERGVPVAITVLNRTDELVSVHWHGIEVQSYFDGVADWSGRPGHTAPKIAPGDSFVVRLNPDRAGTFIYHTHQDEGVQLSSGLYGPFIVVEPGQTVDSATDHVFLIGRGGAAPSAAVLLNGAPAATAVEWRAGTTHRLRFINITPNDAADVTLLRDSTAQHWRLFAKDGADVAPAQTADRPARVTMGPGETYDFDITPNDSTDLTLQMIVRGRVGPIGTIRLPIRIRQP
ncbi:MAG TPA: multicopper oxidase domain-containing protein [Gemmatimonadales bacterium]|nr:multicopper oxidase domain-containing protein [Gemmatimonadales bacterium]